MLMLSDAITDSFDALCSEAPPKPCPLEGSGLTETPDLAYFSEYTKLFLSAGSISLSMFWRFSCQEQFHNFLIRELHKHCIMDSCIALGRKLILPILEGWRQYWQNENSSWPILLR
jgi:hypothetical protein